MLEYLYLECGLLEIVANSLARLTKWLQKFKKTNSLTGLFSMNVGDKLRDILAAKAASYLNGEASAN